MSGSKKGLTYADTGVDIDAGDRVVGMIQSMLKRTHGPRVIGQHGAVPIHAHDCRLVPADIDGAFPEGF